jgi:hypothetical protein
MAKDQFYRTKPHISVVAINGLRSMGFSGLGVNQIMRAEPLLNPNDRKLAAEILVNATSGKRQHKTFTIEKHVDKVKAQLLYTVGHLNGGKTLPAVMLGWRQLGFSPQAVLHIALGQPVSESADRELLCEVLMRESVALTAFHNSCP